MNPISVNQRAKLLPVMVFFAVVIVGVALLPSSQIPCEAIKRNDTLASKTDGGAAFEGALPEGWKIALSNPRGKGWRQTGEIPLDISAACRDVAELMRNEGLSCRHIVDEDEDHARMLLQYEGRGQKVLWALWRQDWNRTGFSWGISR